MKTIFSKTYLLFIFFFIVIFFNLYILTVIEHSSVLTGYLTIYFSWIIIIGIIIFISIYSNKESENV